MPEVMKDTASRLFPRPAPGCSPLLGVAILAVALLRAPVALAEDRGRADLLGAGLGAGFVFWELSGVGLTDRRVGPVVQGSYTHRFTHRFGVTATFNFQHARDSLDFEEGDIHVWEEIAQLTLLSPTVRRPSDGRLPGSVEVEPLGFALTLVYFGLGFDDLRWRSAQVVSVPLAISLSRDWTESKEIYLRFQWSNLVLDAEVETHPSAAMTMGFRRRWSDSSTGAKD